MNHPGGGKPAVGVPHAAVRLCAVLHEGHGAAVSDDAAYLSRDHTLRRAEAHGGGVVPDLSGDRPLVASTLRIP